jgi:hypothetical protein
VANRGPTWTREHRVESLELETGSLYIFGASSAEDRSTVPSAWRAAQEGRGVDFYEVTAETQEDFSIVSPDGTLESIILFDLDGMVSWFKVHGKSLYLDVTSIALRTWAPMLRALMLTAVPFRLVYTEPDDYVRDAAGDGGFDLSELTEGIAAVPGFARISDTFDSDVPFIPLLGFEGARLTRMIQKLEVARDLTYPLIGLPGYRVEFPFHALAGNRSEMERGGMHSRHLIARANCPFDAFYEIARVHEHHAHSSLQLAPLGTKPHAIGAVLYAISHDTNVELVYDHPRQASRPSTGSARVCVYYVSDFLASDYFAAFTP